MEAAKSCWVDRVKAPAHGQRDVKAKFPGLYIRAFAPRPGRAQGRIVWFLKARMNSAEGSASKFVLLGEYPALGEHDAERAAAEARHQLRQGVDPNAARDERLRAAKAASLTFGELVEEYLAGGGMHKGRPLRPTTLRIYSTVLRGKWFADWRSRPLAAITQNEVNLLTDRIPETAAYSPLAALRAAMRYAKNHGYVSEAPEITIPKSKSDKAPFLNYHEGEEADIDFSELCAVLDALDEIERRFPLSPWPNIWRFGCLTGARPSAILGASWEEFSLGEKPTWHLSAERSKLRRAIEIPLSETAAALLRSMPRKQEGLIWPATRNDTFRQFYPPDQTAVINERLRARGYKTEFWPARFRDTLATWLDAQEHATERAKARLLDHTAPAETGIRGAHYALVMSERLARRLANEWAATIAGARAAAAEAGSSVIPMAMQRRVAAGL